MTDRELLELAAKAADYGFLFSRQLVSTYEWTTESPEMKWQWNPLEDDGQALRLAVKLGINIPTRWEHEKMERCGLDIYAATRRAIVRAAAEIGKGMQ